MTTVYGATPEDWTHWDLMLGLGCDLLPVVCRPGLPIAPTSVLQSYGKVPSRFTNTRHVVGVPSWTSHHSSDQDLARWSSEPDYGICLQTRSVRALDLDLTDPRLVEAVLQILEGVGLVLPRRTRSNSTKCLLLFHLEGEHPKQILPTAAGNIEFLANGQQCLVAGSHPSGVHYEWFGGLPASIPTLTLEPWRLLQADLALVVGTGPWSDGKLRRLRGAQEAVDLRTSADPVVRYLFAHDLTLGHTADGRVHVSCPWAEAHTTPSSDASASSYFPAGTGGYETGRYVCLHAHCQSRSTQDYLDAIGYLLDGFAVIPEPDEDRLAMEALSAFLDVTAPLPTGTVSPVTMPGFKRDKAGHITPLLQNAVLALSRSDWTGLPLMRDDYTDTLMLGTKGHARLFTDDDYIELALCLTRKGFGPGPVSTSMVRDAANYVAARHTFDSAIDWLNGLPAWDGVRRVDGFCTTYLGCEPSAYARAVSRYWWTAHAGRVLSPAIQADMAIVLISIQGTGKTSSIKAMVPSYEHYVELNMSERDQDLSRSMRGKMIGEIAELRGIASRDHEAVKAWVSRQYEEWTPKYCEFSRKFARRLVLVGTSNHEEFLSDETGNRRWLPLRVGDFQDRDKIARDRDQLWAEARAIFCKDGIQWREAELLAKEEHAGFETRDPWEPAIRSWLARPALDGVSPADSGVVRCEDVLTDCLHMDLAHIRMSEKHRVGKILRGIGMQKSVARDGIHLFKAWKMP